MLTAKKNKDIPSRGFKKLNPVVIETDTDKVTELTIPNTIEVSPAAFKIDGTEPKTADDVFKKWKIDDTEKILKAAKSKKSNAEEERLFGEGILDKVPEKLQLQIDNFLITGTFAALTFVVLCGIGISAGALKIVFPQVEMSRDIDSLITNVLDPFFTPALGVFFFFSITLGVF